MALDFTALAATAKRLIDDNGRSVTIVKQGVDDSAAPTKPWRVVPTTAVASVVGIGVFVSTEPGKLGAQWFNPDNLKRGDQIVFFAASNDGGLNLQEFDTLTDSIDSTVWKIVQTQLLRPATVKILYMFVVRR